MAGTAGVLLLLGLCLAVVRAAPTARYDLATLAQGSTGFRIDGPEGSPLPKFGTAVDLADLNGDGAPDVLVAALTSHLPSGVGCVYVVWSTPGLAAQPSVSDQRLREGPNTTLLVGSGPSSRFACSVARAGDFNGDRVDDVVVGAMNETGDLTGCAYVVYGRRGPWPHVVVVDQQALAPSDGLAITGVGGSALGIVVAAAGDVDHDGLDDVLLWAPGWPDSDGARVGAIHCVYGVPSNRTASPVSVAALQRFAKTGTGSERLVGLSLSSGDFDGDGWPDILAGLYNPATVRTPTRVFYGVERVPGGGPRRSPSYAAVIDNRSAAGFDRTHAPIARAIGDINGDGCDELAVGRYVVLGARDKREGGELDLGRMGPAEGFSVSSSALHRIGGSAAPAGDVNGDGVGDFLLSAYRGVGEVLVVFGRRGRSHWGPVDLDSLACDEGYRLAGEAAGDDARVAAADLNGDGVADVVVAQMFSGDHPHGGRAYVVYGVGQPALARNSFAVAQGQRAPLSREQLDVDTLAAPEDVFVRVGSVDAGHFVSAQDPLTDVEEFTLADVRAGRVLLVHDGSATAPSFSISVATTRAGCRWSAPVSANVSFLCTGPECSPRGRGHRSSAVAAIVAPVCAACALAAAVCAAAVLVVARRRRAREAALEDAGGARHTRAATAVRLRSTRCAAPVVPIAGAVPEGEPVHAALCAALGEERIASELVELRGKELKAFQRSFPQYYQMHHEDYTEKRIRANKHPIIFVVAAAWRVVNPTLEMWFRRRREFMRGALGRSDDEMEERVAFHGTRERNIASICSNGVLRVGHPRNPSTSTDAGFFGDPHCGVYASRFVEYTLQYSNVGVTSDGLEMPLALNEGDRVKIVMFKALPGRTLHMEAFMGSVEPTAGYDSHSSPQWSEWFFFDETQLCPTHVVEVMAITNARTEANEGLVF
eukprot:m51a1_g4700 hypothetical protein (936) ;mRNA; r:228863-231915